MYLFSAGDRISIGCDCLKIYNYERKYFDEITANSVRCNAPLSCPNCGSKTLKGTEIRAKEKLSCIKADSAVRCPKCGSTQIQAMKKGFGFGKAAAGAIITGGPLGLLAGGIGAGRV